MHRFGQYFKEIFFGLTISLLLLLSVSMSVSFATEPDEGARRQFTFAAKAYRDGLFRLASEEFERYLKSYPHGGSESEARYFLAESYLQLKKYRIAARAYQRFREEHPQDGRAPIALARQGSSLFLAGDYQAAVGTLEEAAQSLVDEELLLPSLAYLAESYFKLKRYPQAVNSYNRLLGYGGGGEYREIALYSLGWSYFKISSKESAAVAFTRLLKMYPQSEYKAQALFLVGEIMYGLKKYTVSMEPLNRLLNEFPDFGEAPAAALMLAGSYLQVGRLEEAHTAYLRLKALQPMDGEVSDLLYKLASAAIAKGQFEDAALWYGEYAENFPSDVRAADARYWMGLAFLKGGRDDEALTALNRFMSDYPEHARTVEALGQTGGILYRKGDYKGSINVFEKLLLFDVDDGLRYRAWYILGEGYYQLGDCARAADWFGKVVERETGGQNETDALIKMASCSHIDGKYAEAARLYGVLLERGLDGDLKKKVSYDLGVALLEAGDCPAAVTAFNRHIEAYPSSKDPGAYYRMGYCHYSMGEYASAEESLSLYLNEAGEGGMRSEALLMLGAAGMALKRHKSAIKAFDDFITENPGDPQLPGVLYNRALALQELGFVQEAANSFIKAAVADPAYPREGESFLRAGLLLLSEGDREEALSNLGSAASSTAPEVAAEALYWSGRIHYQNGDYDDSYRAYGRVSNEYGGQVKWAEASLFGMGNILEERKEWRKAAEKYQDVAVGTEDPELKESAEERIRLIGEYLYALESLKREKEASEDDDK